MAFVTGNKKDFFGSGQNELFGHPIAELAASLKADAKSAGVDMSRLALFESLESLNSTLIRPHLKAASEILADLRTQNWRAGLTEAEIELALDDAVLTLSDSEIPLPTVYTSVAMLRIEETGAPEYEEAVQLDEDQSLVLGSVNIWAVAEALVDKTQVGLVTSDARFDVEEWEADRHFVRGRLDLGLAVAFELTYSQSAKSIVEVDVDVIEVDEQPGSLAKTGPQLTSTSLSSDAMF